MSIKHIKAEITCDGCGHHFLVTLDQAYEPPQGWSLFDVATDAVRGGANEAIGSCEVGPVSCQSSMHLCADCTRACDNYTDEDRDLTADEMDDAISYRVQGGNGYRHMMEDGQVIDGWHP